MAASPVDARYEAIVAFFSSQPDAQLLQVLGSGASGTVCLALLPSEAEHRQQGAPAQQLVAIKFMDLQPGGGTIISEAIRNELLIATWIHPHIVRTTDIIVPEAWRLIGIVLEPVTGGDLLHEWQQAVHIQRQRHGLSYGAVWTEDLARPLMRQLMLAVYHCHALRVAHRDLKLDNLLLDSQTGYLKLCDFGFATQLVPGSSLVGSCKGTPPYMAPEVVRALRDGPYDGLKADIWAVGVILHLLLCGHKPFRAGHVAPGPQEMAYAEWGACHEPGYQLPSNVALTPACQALLRSMMAADPAQRPSAAQMVGHPWLDAPGLPSFAAEAEHLTSEVQQLAQQNAAGLQQDQMVILDMLTEIERRLR